MFRVLFYFFAKRIRSSSANRLKVTVLFAVLVWYSASGFLYFELPQKPDLMWKDALWWTFVTMTTIGYGDHFPVSTGGRFIVGLPVMLFGIGFLGYIISAVAAQLIESRSRRLKGMTTIRHRDHILIINFTVMDDMLGLIEELRSDPSTGQRKIVLVDEYLEEIPAMLVDRNIDYVRGDPADGDVLERAGVRDAFCAVILAGDRSDPHIDDHNLATILAIEKENPSCHTVAEVLNARKVRQIELAGCNSAVCVAELNTSMLVQEIQDPGVKNVVADLVSNRGGEQFYIISIESDEASTYRDLVLWGMEKCYAVVGLKRGETLMHACDKGERILDGDMAILVGKTRPARVRLS